VIWKSISWGVRVILNKPIFLNTLRSQMDAPLRLVIAGLLVLLLYFFVSGGVTVNATPISGIGSLVTGGNYLLTMLLWLLGLGLISRDISSGSIQLVLLRPLTRASYVLSKWAALVSVGFSVLLFIHVSYLAHHGVDAEAASSLALLFAAQCLQVAAIAAVIALFSTVPINFGELGLLILCSLIFLMLKMLNLRFGLAFVDQSLDYAWRVLLPSVAFAPGFANSGSGNLIASLAFNAVVAVAALSGAIALMARREFTYAEHGG
jgi:ABC-type transport system involved in multi-copper enzyme maturation permease subunit